MRLALIIDTDAATDAPALTPVDIQTHVELDYWFSHSDLHLVLFCLTWSLSRRTHLIDFASEVGKSHGEGGASNGSSG